jgi:glutamine synthetase
MEEITKILKKILSDLQIRIGFGFEFEFFLLNENLLPIDVENYLENLNEILFHSNSFFKGLAKKEIEQGQVEIISFPTFDIEENIFGFKKVFCEVENFVSEKKYFLNYLAKPFLKKSGNGLHINISLHDKKTNKNIFEIEMNNSDKFDLDRTKSSTMNSAISGILKSVESDIELYIFNESTMNRIKYHDINTPTNISWGKNNRTTLIRIPESLPYQKRIEIRLSSPESDLTSILKSILVGIYNGIRDKNYLQPCTHGIAHSEIYQLKGLLNLIENSKQ